MAEKNNSLRPLAPLTVGQVRTRLSSAHAESPIRLAIVSPTGEVIRMPIDSVFIEVADPEEPDYVEITGHVAN